MNNIENTFGENLGENMDNDITYVRGDVLNKLSKFTYRADIIKRITSINNQLNELQDRIELYPSEEKYLLTKENKISHRLDLLRRGTLSRQRRHMMDKLSELEKSIEQDIVSENNSPPELVVEHNNLHNIFPKMVDFLSKKCKI